MNEQFIPALIQFLRNYFNGQELRTLTMLYGFLPVYEDYTEGMSKSRMVELLVDYCRRHDQIYDLLAALQRERADQFEKDFPDFHLQKATHSSSLNRNPQKIFISHAYQDAGFAKRLSVDLRKHNWSIWIAPDSIQSGERWVEAIGRGLEESGIFILILSKMALQSRWVRSEVESAIHLEHQGKMRFLPIQIESCDIPVLWQTYQHVSFEHNYADGLLNLLANLQSGNISNKEPYLDFEILNTNDEHTSPLPESKSITGSEIQAPTVNPLQEPSSKPETIYRSSVNPPVQQGVDQVDLPHKKNKIKEKKSGFSCCFVTILALVAPRLACIIWWIFQPVRWNSGFNSSFLWPMLLVILLPWTALFYISAFPGGVIGFDWVFIILGLIFDLGTYSAGGFGNRSRLGYGD